MLLARATVVGLSDAEPPFCCVYSVVPSSFQIVCGPRITPRCAYLICTPSDPSAHTTVPCFWHCCCKPLASQPLACCNTTIITSVQVFSPSTMLLRRCACFSLAPMHDEGWTIRCTLFIAHPSFPSTGVCCCLVGCAAAATTNTCLWIRNTEAYGQHTHKSAGWCIQTSSCC